MFTKKWSEIIAYRNGMFVSDSYETVLLGLTKNHGQCPCVPQYAQNADTFCPCTEMRKNKNCQCGLFIKEKS